MIQAIFTFLLNLIATLVQLVVFPINLVITNTLPDLSLKIIEVSDVLSTIFDTISWALGLLPSSVIITLVFIIGVEIGKHTIFTSTHALLKAWNVLQKIKFW